MRAKTENYPIQNICFDNSDEIILSPSKWFIVSMKQIGDCAESILTN